MGLTKEQIKGITKREKKKFKYKRTDDMEDPLNFHGADRDHYEVESHRFQVEYQKELLCKGQTFRVSLQCTISNSIKKSPPLI